MGLAALTLAQPRSPCRGLPLGFSVLLSCRAARQARRTAAFPILSLLVVSQGSTSCWLQRPCPRVPKGRGQTLGLFLPSPLAQKKTLTCNCSLCVGISVCFMLCHHQNKSSEPSAQDFPKIFLPVPIYFIRAYVSVLRLAMPVRQMRVPFGACGRGQRNVTQERA